MPALRKRLLAASLLLLGALAASAEGTNEVLFGAAVPAAVPAPEFNAGESLVRVFGALALVMALFFGAVWFYRNWQGVLARKQGGVRLSVVEVRSLGNKQSIVVVGYGAQRMLVGASPAGISMLTHLPAEEAVAAAETAEQPSRAPANPGFMEALHQVIARKRP